MKNFHFLFEVSLLLAGLVSCSKQLPEVCTADVMKTRKEISFTTYSRPLSKSPSPSPTEDRIKRCCVFVFNNDGSLDVSGTSDGSEISLNVTCGLDKKVYVVANQPESGFGEGIIRENQLEGLISNTLTSDTGGDEFVMSGRQVADISETTEEISVPVSRLLSRICIEKIHNRLNPAYGDIVIKEMFLSNVVSDVRYFSDACGTVWLNKMGRNLSSKEWLHEGDLHVIVPNGGSTDDSFRHCFYCAPNSTEADSHLESWCPRYTRLVIKAEIAGISCYYPIDLNSRALEGSILRNHSYKISELTVKHLGTDDPEKPLIPTSVGIKIQICDWDEQSIVAEL